MADLIDRQTAIETAIEAADKWDGAYSPERERVIRKFFDKVPAAQPDHVADIGKKAEGDCISRQAAIDALARMMPRSHTSDGSHPADEEIFRVQEVIADCIEALEILTPAQPETHWISCSERLPEERGFYLTTTKDKAVYCDHWNEDNFDRTEMVIAWMPLPEPYRGGEK